MFVSILMNQPRYSRIEFNVHDVSSYPFHADIHYGIIPPSHAHTAPY